MTQPVSVTAPQGGTHLAELASPPQDQTKNYVASKTGNWFLASELARPAGHHQYRANPRESQNQSPETYVQVDAVERISTPPQCKDGRVYRAMGWFVAPDHYGLEWMLRDTVGRVHPSPRKDLIDALKSMQEGGTGQAGEFREWCEKQTADFK